MSSEIEVLQQSFMESMNSMQKQYESEKKDLEQKVANLQKENKSLKDMTTNSKKILSQLKEKEQNEEMFKEELKKNTNEINDLKKRIRIYQQNCPKILKMRKK